MTKLVILKFQGSLESGFLVNSEIGQEGKSAERGCTGSLPPSTLLHYYLTNWKQHYNRLGNKYRIKPQQIIYDGSFDPKQQLIESASRLEREFSQWLNSPSFNSIDKHLREELNRLESGRILICCDRPQIYQLPWCCWDLLESYPNLEIAMSSPNFARVPILAPPERAPKVRVLAILGDSQGIDLDADYELLDTLDAELIELVEPSIPQLYDYLWQSSWDIVFFAGHSKTLNRQGILYLNDRDKLTIEQLKHGFKQAIASGLQLAIFNSCDGLGLAEELGQLSLPQSIIMRLQVPDKIAQQFVKYFLQAYAGGNSLYLAMRQAREQLQSYEKDFPCASWLPIIYQNPAVIPPQWSDFFPHKRSKLAVFKLDLRIWRQRLISLIAIAAIATISILLVQSWGWLESAELNTYDRLAIWGYTPTVDERVLVVTVNDLDRTFQQKQRMAVNMRGSLADDALNQLLQKLTTANAKAIASDIIHDFPFEPQLAQTIAQTDNFVGICRVKNLPNLISIAPPLEQQQLGFSNWAIDDDGGIRRQILGMSPDDVCTSSLSLSLRLALLYLGDVATKFDSQSPLEIGSAVFPQLKVTSGGYRLRETQGYQILLNYRRAMPTTIPLRDILTMSQTKIDLLAKDKIVLIGVEGYNQDLHHTPYSRGQQAKRFPGVLIHALMTSQIVDVVLEEQKLIEWIDCWRETLWIAFWSTVGAVIIFRHRRSPTKIMLSVALALTLIFFCCWISLLNSIWLIAIAPVLALMLSASLALAYSRS